MDGINDLMFSRKPAKPYFHLRSLFSPYLHI